MKTLLTAPPILAPRALSRALSAALFALLATACSPDEPISPVGASARLTGFAALPAATFAKGPTSGSRLGADAINGQAVPFTDHQPVQGFSAVLKNEDGTFLAMPDNGYGKLENSADFNLRVYTLEPDFKKASGGAGAIKVRDEYIELSDPDKLVPFAITNQFTEERVLTGADFDIESLQRTPDGTLWFGDEFGPFLLHTDAKGKVLDPPIPLPDFDAPGSGKEIRSPQNPFNEEGSTVRVMNAFHAQASAHGNKRTPVFSPQYVLISDGDISTVVANRKDPPAGSGVTAASSEIFDVTSLHAAGYPVVTWTVDTPEAMAALLKLGVDGIISDRPDLLYAAVKAFDANGDGKAGDYLDADGILIDPAKFDAQGHRGGRDLRPENTLPAFEVALDNLMTTLEFDIGITSDNKPVISHDPHILSQKCRRADGALYDTTNEVLIKDLSLAALQTTYICDKLFRGEQQKNDLPLSPVVGAFATPNNLPSIYSVPTLDQVFGFVESYIAYYEIGIGKTDPNAVPRAKNAKRVRFNIETKVNPRAEYAARTIAPAPFADVVATTIKNHSLADRADIQSFDFRTLFHVQEMYPEIRTVYLFGDFPRYADNTIAGTDDGTNLQDENGKPSPWFNGVVWPYRKTKLSNPFRAQTSGGFEAMAMRPDGKKLFPLIERSIDAADGKVLLIHEFDVETKQYTGVRYQYKLDDKGVSVTDFILIDDKHGLVIERDDTEGDLNGHKVVYEVKLGEEGSVVEKKLAVDLLKIDNPSELGGKGSTGDVGLGASFAFPFKTIEAIVQIDKRQIGVLNDNNYPFGLGRHLGSKLTDDNEFILIDVGHDLGGF